MGRMEDIDARLKSRMDAMNKRLSGRMAALDAKSGLTDGNSSAGCIERRCAAAQTSNGKAASAVSVVAGNDDRWCYSDKIMYNMWDMIRSMPYVQDNAQYKSVADKVQFNVLHSSDEPIHFSNGDMTGDDINAFAYRKDSWLGTRPVIYVCSGAMRYARLMSAAYAQMSFPACFRDMAARWLLLGSCSISPDFAEKFSNDHGLNKLMKVSRAEEDVDNVALGGLMGVVAHELGHQVYGHCMGGNGGEDCETSLEISRHRERDADSFASAITSQSKFKKDMGMGTIIWHLAFVIRDCIRVRCNPESIKTFDHPHELERLLDFVNHNESTIKAIGIGWAEIGKLLSDLGINLTC